MNKAVRSGIWRWTDVAECIFFHSEYVYHLNEMSNPISDVKSFIIQLIWGFKIHHSFLYNKYTVLAYFDTYAV